MSSSPKIAVIGAGFAGRWIHTRGYHAAGAHVSAICDVRPEAAQEAASEYGIDRAYGDWREMLERERPDVVSVCVPNTFHEEPTVAALESGAHVICEKPLSTSVASAERMFAAARRAGRHLMAAQMYRFGPQARSIKAAVERGELGRVYYAEATALRRFGFPGKAFHVRAASGGGPLLDIGVHMLDLALWLCGSPRPVSVSATVTSAIANQRDLAGLPHDPDEYDVEDFAVALCRLEGGVTLLLRTSWAANIPERDVMQTRILGDRAGAGHQPGAIWRMRDGMFSDESLEPKRPVDGWLVQMAHWFDVVRGRAEPAVLPEETLNVQRILNAAYESGASGAEVRIDAAAEAVA